MMAILVIWLITALVAVVIFAALMTSMTISAVEELADVAHKYRALLKESALDWIQVTSAGAQAQIDTERERARLDAEGDLLALTRARMFHEHRLAIRAGKQAQQ